MPITRAQHPEKYTFDTIEIGEKFGPVEGVLSDLQVKMQAFAITGAVDVELLVTARVPLRHPGGPWTRDVASADSAEAGH